MNYYYLLPSLPMLFYDRVAPLSYEQFLGRCTEVLKPNELSRLKAFNFYVPPTNLKGLGLLEYTYWCWDISLKNSLVKLRAEALGLNPELYLRPIEVAFDTDEQAKKAFKETNPLEVEEDLNLARWTMLESKKTDKYFEFDLLLIYGMQLQILERKQSFKREKGIGRYESEYEKALQSVETVLAENI